MICHGQECKDSLLLENLSIVKFKLTHQWKKYVYFDRGQNNHLISPGETQGCFPNMIQHTKTDIILNDEIPQEF